MLITACCVISLSMFEGVDMERSTFNVSLREITANGSSMEIFGFNKSGKSGLSGATNVSELSDHFKMTPKLNLSTNQINGTLKQREVNQELFEKNCFYLWWNIGRDNNRSGEEKSDRSVTFPNRTCNRFITLRGVIGRTGNQLFEVAAVLGTAYRYNLVPVLSSKLPLRQWFDFPAAPNVTPSNVTKFHDIKCAVYRKEIENLEKGANISLGGYFQSWRYFLPASHVIRNSFMQIKSVCRLKAIEFIRQVSKPGWINVCAHIRRGDMASHTASEFGYAIADLNFIQNSFKFYKTKFKQVQFIIVSDGMSWCKQNIREPNVVFSPFNDVGSDLALMTQCDHAIVTSGTFGWWGAWLAGGTTVYFAGYPAKGSKLEKDTNRSDYYPNDWIGLT